MTTAGSGASQPPVDRVIALVTPVAKLPGVQRRTAEALAGLGIRAVAHLLTHVPYRYEREHDAAPIASLVEGDVGAARGEVTACRVAGFGRRQRFEAVLCDDSGRVDLVWFNAPYLRKKIGAGTRMWVQGKPRRYRTGLQIANPRFRILGVDEPDPEETESNEPAGERLRPIYPASEGVRPETIERLIEQVLPDALAQIEEHLPEQLLRRRELPSLAEAYRRVHKPSDEAEAETGRRRLAYDELIMLQLGVFLKKAYVEHRLKAPPLRFDDATQRAIVARLPFQLTPAQSRVVQELARDLTEATPANRLIQGDVGSGKTAVAACGLLMAVATGHQGALLAPTEILAEQHHAALSELLKGSSVRVELLTGSLQQAARKSALGRVASGEADIVVGTHALLTESVRFKSLALAVIDEQHRFGVHQRAHLRGKGPAASDGETADADAHTTPHVLVMTATPIPRTLAMTLFGDLDVSTIDELPPGRQPIETRVFDPRDRPAAEALLAERIDRGERGYVVVPAIDPSPEGGLASVRETVSRLQSGVLIGRRVAALHGRMNRREREHVMERFRRGLIDCLIATTVIEVGVDVPEATVMLIDNAERFGLAQLHQLRGRVGRGSEASVCILIGDANSDEGRQRLEAMASTRDGFELAERDMQIRGPGELFGARQSGLPPFKVADLIRDLELLRLAREDAAEWVSKSPGLDRPEDAIARRRLLKRFGDALGLADIG